MAPANIVLKMYYNIFTSFAQIRFFSVQLFGATKKKKKKVSNKQKTIFVVVVVVVRALQNKFEIFNARTNRASVLCVCM